MIPSPFEFAVIVFAAHRLWTIWNWGKIAEPLRLPLVKRGGWIGYLASCHLCISVWAGFTAWSMWWTGPVGQFVVVGLAAGCLIFAWQALTGFFESTTVQHQVDTEIKKHHFQRAAASSSGPTIEGAATNGRQRG